MRCRVTRLATGYTYDLCEISDPCKAQRTRPVLAFLARWRAATLLRVEGLAVVADENVPVFVQPDVVSHDVLLLVYRFLPRTPARLAEGLEEHDVRIVLAFVPAATREVLLSHVLAAGIGKVARLTWPELARLALDYILVPCIVESGFHGIEHLILYSEYNFRQAPSWCMEERRHADTIQGKRKGRAFRSGQQHATPYLPSGHFNAS
jgi:hypothetical protein